MLSRFLLATALFLTVGSAALVLTGCDDDVVTTPDDLSMPQSTQDLKPSNKD